MGETPGNHRFSVGFSGDKNIPGNYFAEAKIELVYLQVYTCFSAYLLEGSSALVQTTGYLLRACSAQGKQLANFSKPARLWIRRLEADLFARTGREETPEREVKV